MKVLIFTIFIFAGMLSCRKNDPADLAGLKQKIKTRLDAGPGVYALAFRNPDDTVRSILINPHEVFHAASTMKTPVMIEVFRQAAEGRFRLSDSVTVHNSFTSIADGSRFSVDQSRDDEKTLYQSIGKKRTIGELTYDMIIRSSNLATDNIIELIGADSINPSMRKLGAVDINILRGVEDMKAYDRGLNNTTTAYDLMMIYDKLARGEVVNPSASRKMIDILSDQTDNVIIPALLPEKVHVAHKTGEIDSVRHDSGIVYLPDGRKYVLVMLSKKIPDIRKAEKKMAGISRMIYDYMAGNGIQK